MRQTSIAMLLLGATAVVGATTFVAADLSALAREAQTIARGHVSAVESRWSDDHRRIETLVTLEAETYLKGGLGGSVEFLVPGGRLGRFRSIVVGAPQFHPGDRVIVFLGATAPNLPHVIGLSQGLFRIVPQSDGWTVTPTPLVASAGTTTRIVRGDPARPPMPLEAFEREVRALAGSSR